MKRIFFWNLHLWVALAVLLAGIDRSFAVYPPMLVINGVVCSGTQVTGSSGNYSKYTSGDGVLLLRGAQGGAVGWGATENIARDTPSVTGNWDGGLNVYISGSSPSVSVPNLLVSYPSVVTAPSMNGYDGVSRAPLGTGTMSDGRFFAAYNGLPSDGYIFTFGAGAPCYRYQSGPAPAILNTGSNGAWPPSNLFAFPAQLFLNGNALNSASFTEGFNQGYWSNEYYVSGTNAYANVHLYVSPDATTGTMWGDVNGTQISATWNPSTQTFTGDAGIGISFTPDTPRYGPPQIEMDGVVCPFRYRDVQGSDIYSDATGATQIVLDSSSNFTARNADETFTGYFDGENFCANGGWYAWNYNIAGVSADGMSFFYYPSMSAGFIIYTSGWDPGQLSSSMEPGAGAWAEPSECFYGYWTESWMYKFKRANGTWAFAFSINQYYGGSYLKWDNSPIYPGSNYSVVDAVNGWPESSIPSNILPAIPPKIYINGEEYYLSVHATDYFACFYALYVNDSCPNGLLMTCMITDNGLGIVFNDNGVAYASGSAATAFLTGVYLFQYTSLNGYSTDGSSYLSTSPVSMPKFGPAQITWNGATLSFVNCSGTSDLYSSGSGAQATISGSGTVTVTGTHAATGTYNFNTFKFNFGGDQAMRGFFAQSPQGDLLGTAAGLVVNITNSNTWSPPPAGWQDPSGRKLVMQNGSIRDTSTTNVYTYHRNQNTAGVKYLGLADGCLFRIADANGNFVSPVYRYTTSGSDFVINAGHDYTDPGSYWWDTTNLYPSQLYVNGHYAPVDMSSASSFPAGNGSLGGAVNYIVQPTGETISILWTFGNSGFSAAVSGSYQGLSVSGTWDGYKIFGNLAPGLVISVDPPVNAVRYGPSAIVWNGVVLTFDPVGSTVTPNNPQGRDVYIDPQGSSMRVTVARDGSVLVSDANGVQYSGGYSASALHFDFGNQQVGSVVALDAQGNPTNRSASTATGTAGSVSEFRGNLDIQGDFLTLGSWTDSSGHSVEGLSISFADVLNQGPTALRFAAIRQSASWIWSHAETDGSSTQNTMMQLDSSNRLLLYNSQPHTTGTANQPTIVLDPALSGTTHFKGPVQIDCVQPQGDLDMGNFKNSNGPQ